ncbi:hypothetical protein CR513_49432, partial [Mucuna pruriens]
MMNFAWVSMTGMLGTIISSTVYIEMLLLIMLLVLPISMPMKLSQSYSLTVLSEKTPNPSLFSCSGDVLFHLPLRIHFSLLDSLYFCLSFAYNFLDSMTKPVFPLFLLVWGTRDSYCPFRILVQLGSDTNPCFFYPQETSSRMHLVPPLKETSLQLRLLLTLSLKPNRVNRRIWYRDDTQDSLNEDPQAWVDPEVRKVPSVLTRSSTLLGMEKAICQRGPWSVSVSPNCHGESVSTTLSVEGKPYFYMYDTLYSKLGVKLPFTHFERAILQALNVAPTQLHPNSWPFVRAFELLCDDLGKALTLGVFFWFFTVRKADKSSRHKLFKPFLESYKSFKTRFFSVVPSDSGPNLLLDHTGRPFFPLSWTHQPAVSVTVRRKDLEEWEDAFVRELEELPLLPSADIIKGVGRLFFPCPS